MPGFMLPAEAFPRKLRWPRTPRTPPVRDTSSRAVDLMSLQNRASPAARAQEPDPLPHVGQVSYLLGGTAAHGLKTTGARGRLATSQGFEKDLELGHGVHVVPLP